MERSSLRELFASRTMRDRRRPEQTRGLGGSASFVFLAAVLCTGGCGSDTLDPIVGPENVDPRPIQPTLYAAGAGGLSVINLGRDSLETTLGQFSGGVVVTRDGAYAFTRQVVPQRGPLQKVDLQTYEAEEVGGSIETGEMVLTPNGDFIYALGGSTTVLVIDVAQNTVVGSPITVGDGASAIVMSPAGDRVYVSNFDSDHVSVIDVSTNAVTLTLDSGLNPADIAITPDGNRLYVANDVNPGLVTVIDLEGDSILTTVFVEGIGAKTIAISPDGRRAYLEVTGSLRGIPIIDLETNSLESVLMGPPDPFFMGRVTDFVFSQDGARVYISAWAIFDIKVFDLSTREMVARIETLGGNDDLAIYDPG